MTTNPKAAQAPAIEENTFYKILIDPTSTATLAEKVEAVAATLTFDARHPAENQERLNELDHFTDFIQSERVRFMRDLINLSDFSAFGQFGEICDAVSEFEKSIKQITDGFTKQNSNDAAQNEDQDRLLKAAQGMIEVSKKITAETLPHLIEQKKQIGTMCDDNQELINASGALSEGSIQAAAKTAGGLLHKKERRKHESTLNDHAADIAKVQKNLQQQSDMLKMMENMTSNQISETRKAAGNMANQVSSIVGTVMIAAADFNKAAAAAPAPQQDPAPQPAPMPLVLPDEVQQAIAILNDASTEKKPARSRRPSAGPRA